MDPGSREQGNVRCGWEGHVDQWRERGTHSTIVVIQIYDCMGASCTELVDRRVGRVEAQSEPTHHKPTLHT